MKTKVVAMLLSFFVLPVQAAEFISLTRSANSLENMPTNVSVITKEEIEQLGAVTLTDIIDIAPGIKTESTGSFGGFAGVKIRGVPTANHTQVVIDDQPLGGSSIQNIDIGMIPVEDIERIEVVRGAASSLYGANTIGGVIHIITKKTASDTPLSGTIRYEGRSHQTHIQTTEVRASNEQVRGYVLGRRWDTQGYQDNSDGTNSYVTGSVGTTFAGDMKLDYDYSVTQQEQGITSGTPVEYEDWNGDREREPFTPTDRIDKKQVRNRVRLVMPLERMMIQSTGHHFTDERETVSFIPSDSKNTIMGNDTHVFFDFGFTAGASYERDERISLNQVPQHITTGGAYVQQEVKLNALTLIPALRWDKHSIFGSEYNPRVAAVFRASDHVKVTGNVARAVRAPTITDLFETFPSSFDSSFDFFPNPNLKPETAWTYDLGTEVAGESGAFALTGFYTTIKDRIAAVDPDGVPNLFGDFTNNTTANISEAKIYGTETEIKLRTGPVLNIFNHTYQYARGTTATSQTYVDLRRTPRHLINYQLHVGLWRGANVVNLLQYVSHQFNDDNHGDAYIPPSTVWNIRLNQAIGEQCDVFVGIENVTDELYASTANFGNPVPEPTRIYQGGISFEFR